MPIQGLSKEQIDALLAKPVRQSRRSGARPGIDTSKRDYDTWFKLYHSIADSETGEPRRCTNPNCADPRDHSKYAQIVAEVNGQYICRFCFFDGYLSENPNQTSLDFNHDNDLVQLNPDEC